MLIYIWSSKKLIFWSKHFSVYYVFWPPGIKIMFSIFELWPFQTFSVLSVQIYSSYRVHRPIYKIYNNNFKYWCSWFTLNLSMKYSWCSNLVEIMMLKSNFYWASKYFLWASNFYLMLKINFLPFFDAQK